jgi:N-acetylglucosaminyldiphosphoundecaprenol N-acetyl-beta-D-mannosaminyltransferase
MNMKAYKTAQEVGQILGINVNSSSKASVLARVEDFISDSTKFYIVTPNPELILMAEKNKTLKNALNSADLSIPDGFGLKVADPSLNIIKGRELFMDLIELANKKNWKAVLLGGLGNEGEVASQKLIKKYPKLQIKAIKGPILGNSAKPATINDEKLEKEAIDQINFFKPDLLFVAFGNPKQEIWIHEHLGKLNVGGAMAVGGTFRYIAGLSKLPPKWMARIGLEWLWRLITEPVRIGRILRAVIVFPLYLFTNRIVSFTREQRD